MLISTYKNGNHPDTGQSNNDLESVTHEQIMD